MKKTFAKIALITTFIQLIGLVTIPFLTNSIESNSIMAFGFYFLFTIFCLYFFKKELAKTRIILIILGTMILIQSYTIYLFLLGQTAFAPILLIYCLGILSAYLCLILKNPVNLIPLFLSGVFLIFMFFQGWAFWLHYRNFDTFTGVVTAYNLPAKFEAFDEKKNLILDTDLENKIVLLDFWYSGCGICFEKFPQLQSAYEKYRNDKSVVIFAVNKPIEEDKPNQAFDMIRERQFSFPVIITKDEDLAEKFGVKGYPTTFVINQNKQIVYKGDIEGAIRMVDELREPK